MSRPPSEATQIRTLKRLLAKAECEAQMRSVAAAASRARAIQAEQEAKEWKERFDLLLRRTDKESNDGR